ncbi:MAG TPA: hypothetical protein VN224_16755 [Xanthomonadales bacterium]|nr:hypothetical protein [Xanthomonadales bacterium]
MPWLSTTLAILAAAGTALGAWGTYQSNQNKGRIDDLTAQIQATQQFAAGIHEARDFLSTDKQVRAMVEFSRLYTLARTPQQKLVLIQMAQFSKQWQALTAMSILMGSDELQASTSEADRKTLASIRTIISNAALDINKEGEMHLAAAAKHDVTPKPKATPVGHGKSPKGRSTPKPTTAPGTSSDAGSAPVATSGDAPLTQSTNAAVAASAALIAALPKTAKQRGWIFVGDVKGDDARARDPGAPILPLSASTSAHAVPQPGATITACQDVNLRDAPSGKFGKLVTIISRGTAIQVQPDPGVQSAFSARSVVYNGMITARWAFVEVNGTVTQDAPAGCPS